MRRVEAAEREARDEEALAAAVAAHGELAQAPLPEAGVDALAHPPSFVDAFAVRASHAPAPGGNAGAVGCK